MEGSTIAYAGSNAKLDVISAIVSNIWDSYNSESTKLDVLLLDCEVDLQLYSQSSRQVNNNNKKKQNKLVITKVSELLLCIVSTEKGEFGVLKAKVIILIYL